MIEEFSTFGSMNKRNHVRAFFSIVLVFFLFVPIVIRSLPSYFDNPVKNIGYYKASRASSKTDIQLPYEEKEKEEKIGSSTSPSLFVLELELAHFDSIDESCFYYNTTKPLVGALPLYLAKRSLII